ncbi:glycosyltransferase [Methyloversatilis thermotolerans]|uniref:glycosyltransferase n=1 Tax=Methyloversatilis thermotolerans TaxID=1346290 RepID=UPI000477AEE0|nr:nucleotide disphospho-sugar-binding domain-containing protein [Methyloversatilis thermotolerans]
MARILFCWELGGDYGHLSRLVPLALELRAQGHEPVFALRDLMGAEALLQPHDLPFFQAPLWIGQVTGLPPAVSYAELLMRFGFLNARALTGIARAWRKLIAQIDPALLVVDHAPTALLASRGLPLRRLHVGDGFCIPPARQPLPAFRWWEPAPLRRLADSEAHVLRTANEVLALLSAPTLSSLSDLSCCDAGLMLGFRELDPYPEREDALWLGPVFGLAHGRRFAWPDGAGPRVFAYLKPGYAGLDAMLAALADLPARVIAHVPGVAARTVAQHSRNAMHIDSEPLDIAQVQRECDVAVSHGGSGTVASMLLAGKPLVIAPIQMEQAMTSRRLAQLGMARVIDPDALAHAPAILRAALADDTMRAAAKQFAARHGDYSMALTVRRAVEQCTALLGASA